MSVECFVSVFESPSCLPLGVFRLLAGLEVVDWSFISSLVKV